VRRRAYTLIEILIVVVILGIAAALVVPAMGDTGVLRVQAAVRTIVSDLNMAQSEAAAHQENYAAVFFPDENRYVVVQVPSGAVDPTQNIIASQRFGNGTMGDSVLKAVDFAGSTILIFNEMGEPQLSSEEGGVPQNGTIEIEGTGQTFRITVQGYTGRITVERVEGGG
jgi:prepilin-type N-terminal cleavage/methylation domain-containing protein